MKEGRLERPGRTKSTKTSPGPLHARDVEGVVREREDVVDGALCRDDVAALYRMMSKSGGLFTYHGEEAELEFGGRKIFVTHMPRHGYAFACTGDYDLVCHGHSHTAHVGKQSDVKGGHCWLVNPGSVAGIDAPGVNAVPTWILGDLEKMNFEIRALQHSGEQGS